MIEVIADHLEINQIGWAPYIKARTLPLKLYTIKSGKQVRRSLLTGDVASPDDSWVIEIKRNAKDFLLSFTDGGHFNNLKSEGKHMMCYKHRFILIYPEKRQIMLEASHLGLNAASAFRNLKNWVSYNVIAPPYFNVNDEDLCQLILYLAQGSGENRRDNLTYPAFPDRECLPAQVKKTRKEAGF